MDFTELFVISKSTVSSVTLEATVATGFECVALDECKEKLGSCLKICKSRGRIFLNVDISQIYLVLGMRSIDNVYVIAHAAGSNCITNTSKDEAIGEIKKLADCLTWEKVLSLWKSIYHFQGNCYPSKVEYSTSLIEETKIKDEVKVLLLASENEMNASNQSEDSTHTACEVLLHSPRNKNCSENATSYTFHSNPKLSARKFYQEIDNRAPSEKVLKYRVTCYRSGQHAFSSQEAAYHFGGELQDKFNWIVDLVHFDMEIVLNIKADQIYVTIALTKESMHRRNINHFGPTTLRSTVCYNLLHLGEPKPGEVVIDPLCGGGSIPIEGALAFHGTFHICGDLHPKATARSWANVNDLSNNMKKNIDILSWDVKHLPLRNSSVDLFVTDLPFGKRSGSRHSNQTLYKDVFLELARVIRRVSGRAVILTHDKKNLMKTLHQTHELWFLAKIIGVNIGGLEAAVYVLKRTDTDFLTIRQYSNTVSKRKKNRHTK